MLVYLMKSCLRRVRRRSCICDLRNVLNYEMLQSRDHEKGLVQGVFKLKEYANQESLLPKEYIHHVNEEITLLRVENAKIKEQEINLTYLVSGRARS